MATRAAADSGELIAQSQKLLREGRALQAESRRRLVESHLLLDQCAELTGKVIDARAIDQTLPKLVTDDGPSVNAAAVKG